MKQCNLTKGLVFFLTIMITLFCGLMPGAWAGDNCDYCEDQKFKGCYGFSHDGMMITPDTGPLPVPMASVGVFYLDGKGNLTGHEMVNFGGTSFPAEISGDYTVYPDCTGTATICAIPYGSPFGIESTISFVITGKGEELQMLTTIMTPCGTIDTIENYVPINIVGTAKKQSCDDEQQSSLVHKVKRGFEKDSGIIR